jgi:ribosomal protein S27E
MPTAPTESSVTPSQPLTMIECVGCGDIAFTLVVYPEADALFSDGTISRPCKLCGKRTQWGRLLIMPAMTRN